ncbi:hypothetical protein Hdeb2414_s0018g00518651 [Helianthus debilis subsp. tardiflorus]
MVEKASCDKSRSPLQPGGGQKSVIITFTVGVSVQGCGTPWLVAPVQVTWKFFPQASPSCHKSWFAAAIITP